MDNQTIAEVLASNPGATRFEDSSKRKWELRWDGSISLYSGNTTIDLEQQYHFLVIPGLRPIC